MEIKRISYGSSDYEAEVKLRDEVLRKPLGLSYSENDLDADKQHVHFGAFDNGQLLGCLLLADVSVEKPHESSVRKLKMRQVAVSPKAQGKGVGKKLVLASEAFAKENRYQEIQLAARETAVEFYKSLDYEVYGEPFVEVTLPHRMMRKRIL